MDLIKELESQQMKAEKPVANVGDTVRVHVKIKEGAREEGTRAAKMERVDSDEAVRPRHLNQIDCSL